MAQDLNPERITMYTTTWCGDCIRAKRFLDNLGIGYNQVDITDDPEARRYVEEVNGGYRSVPTIVFPSSKVLVEPSNRELQQVLVSEGLLKAS